MDSKCAACKDSPCCKIIPIPVNTPKTRKDYNLLLFYIAHKDVEVFRRGDNWFVLFRSPCEFLTEDGLCGIYEDRPNSCRVYKNIECEVDISITDKSDQSFSTYQELLIYVNELYG